jgi:ATP-dependent protease ClpP protease subunit
LYILKVYAEKTANLRRYCITLTRELIKIIQEIRDSKVVVYFTGDRQLAGARIAEDAVRPLYDHLLAVGKNPRIDIFLYSRGGDVSVPWRIISMFREFCSELSILVPYKAHSAATLMSLGADRILMGKKAELGPIDPTLVKMMVGETAGQPQEISVEDVNSYLSFLKERANINDQSALATLVSILADNLSPLTLGSVNRQNSHIRLVARKLLTSRAEKLDEAKINSIVETLTEKMYSHGHAIGRNEAQEIGLPVESPSEDLDAALWQLFLRYEERLSLYEPLDPLVILEGKEEEHLREIPVAVIESENKLHVFNTQIDIKRRRQVPPSPQINLNLGLNLPPQVKLEEIPQQVQQIIQQIINQVAQETQRLVQQEIMRQSPEVGIDVRVYGGQWKEFEEGAA